MVGFQFLQTLVAAAIKVSNEPRDVEVGWQRSVSWDDDGAIGVLDLVLEKERDLDLLVLEELAEVLLDQRKVVRGKLGRALDDVVPRVNHFLHVPRLDVVQVVQRDLHQLFRISRT